MKIHNIRDEPQMLTMTDHCLEVLRMKTLCQADFSLYTLRFDSPEDKKAKTVIETPQKCVKWDPLKNWVLEHAVDPDEYIASADEAKEAIRSLS